MRRTSNTQSEKWHLGRLFAPSTALEEDLELEEEVPVEDEVEEDGKLEEEEQEERGRSVAITWNYLVYLKACGVGFGLAYLVCAVAGQGEYSLSVHGKVDFKPCPSLSLPNACGQDTPTPLCVWRRGRDEQNNDLKLLSLAGVSVVLDFWLGRWTGEASRWNKTRLTNESNEEEKQEFVERTVRGDALYCDVY